ncbi:cupredoxin domain-containing protein [Diaphorobacter caeni]|uniref:hypothetical protein n=1 Tax=Diaphorobacter caeni TaxID=2784387 RepID=UPI00188E69EC|nr:hypothetical protein [Diaphorobacter caeni]
MRFSRTTGVGDKDARAPRHVLQVPPHDPMRVLVPVLFLAVALASCTAPPTAPEPTPQAPPQPPQAATQCHPGNTTRAEIVALEQAYVLNRFGAFVPAGMMYALKRDVVALDSSKGPAGPGNARLREDKRPRPLVLRAHEGGCLQVTLHNWLAPEWEDEGGKPPDPTVPLNGERVAAAPAHLMDPIGSPSSRRLKPLSKVSVDAPRTRSASFFVAGLDVQQPRHCPVNAVCGGDGTYVGLRNQQGIFFNPGTSSDVRNRYQSGSVIQPGQVSVTLWSAPREGSFFAHSTAAPIGGEGDGGQIGLGLFAAVNVEPPQSRWYRSQVDEDIMRSVTKTPAGGDAHPFEKVDYEQISLVQNGEIVHSDLNAIIVRSAAQHKRCETRMKDTLVDGQRCEPSFREFTVILHDEVHAVQAFPELEDEDNPLHYIKDGMGINYGVSSMGSTAYAAQPQRGVGPAAKCPECRAEEFFLSSWANGDPALVLKWDGNGERPTGARYPDDPSNVHHSYLGDPVVFRNLHAGPKETHVFHLHAHQWVMDASDPNSTYLDSQTIAPGATFSYGIEFGGSGNRNLTVGDSIFHCHLYPHFAQGMWELWRVHDVFESGLHRGNFDPAKPVSASNDPQSRSLPDAEVAEGIASPAIVPLPGIALAPMPSAAFRGYPFYVAGQPGHRPPQPVLDMDVNDTSYTDYTQPPDPAKVVDGGLPRHVVKSGEVSMLARERPGTPGYRKLLDAAKAKGGDAAQLIGAKVAREFPTAFEALAGEWKSLEIEVLPHEGTTAEKAAMRFHEGKLAQPASLADGGLNPVVMNTQPRPGWWTYGNGYRTAFAASTADMNPPDGEPLFRVNGRGRAPGAPFANPCPINAPKRDYRAAFIQTEITVNRHGWFDPQGRIVILEDDIKDVINANNRTKMPEPLFFRANSGDCINFKSSNFVPSALNADDFQIYTPTDTIGQHIHLVKFDVTSSDGSGNGFNYEDGAYSPDEVRERIMAINHTAGRRVLSPKAHPLFQPHGSIYENRGRDRQLADKGLCPPQGASESDHAYLERLNKHHPYCGAQRTTQRWWADPILVRNGPLAGKDNTLRTVFTHDHFGPSSHQQHGLYAALVIEPANSVWRAELPADPVQRKSLLTACAAVASANADDPLSLDAGIKASFAERRRVSALGAQATAADQLSAARAETCLAHALIGGADLSVDPIALGGSGDEQIAMLKPRPTLKLIRDQTGNTAPASAPTPTPGRLTRTDGGPTSTRATIVSPTCVNEPASSPYLVGNEVSCASGEAHQTRREFGLAFADFSTVYNLALEPINTELPRDVSMRRFGERQVAVNPARPLVIASEDPGTQLVNYRNEPLALRIADVHWSPSLGGFDYSESSKRADGSTCRVGDSDCLRDMANGFSSAVHARRDHELATRSYVKWIAQNSNRAAPQSEVDLVSPTLRAMQSTPKQKALLRTVVRQAEQWRQDFNCALYPSAQWRLNGAAPDFQFESRDVEDFRDFCAARERASRRTLQVNESWRAFGDVATPILASHEGDPVQIRLVQGSQEAQHIFTMNGVKWLSKPDSEHSGYTNAQPIGISEHFEFDVRIPNFSLPQADYLYFGSSVDQLWDGMWGTLRAYCDPSQGRDCGLVNERDQIARLIARVPRATATPTTELAEAQTAACTSGRALDEAVEVKSFDVSVAKVCELMGDCGSPTAGLEYSRRFDIRDPQAVVYVLNRESRTCRRDAGKLTDMGCFDGTDPAEAQTASHADNWAQLQQQFRQQRRPIEPLVLRAAAGQCITVKLRNHLAPAQPRTTQLTEAHAHYNFLPMITDGFNLNQFTMSSTVGLSAPRVAQNPLHGDGSNVSLNAALVAAETGVATSLTQAPGSLVPACKSDEEREADRCSRTLVWSARDLHRVVDAGATRVESRAVEFGGLPLRSFGDVVKHAAHGMAGALVIGPEGSRVCDDDQRDFPGGASRTVCTADGHRYGDHVLLMQDAVSAVQRGFPVPDLKGAEEPDDYGVKAINFRTEPLWARTAGSPSADFGDRNENFDLTRMLSSARQGAQCEAGMPPNGDGPLACDPETPVINATAGQPVRLHFVHAGGHTRQQGLTVAGHGFPFYPWSQQSRVFDATRCDTSSGPMQPGCLSWQGVYNGFGPMMGVTLGMVAGGKAALPKDYLIRSQASFVFDGGAWSILRVRGPSDESSNASTKP